MRRLLLFLSFLFQHKKNTDLTYSRFPKQLDHFNLLVHDNKEGRQHPEIFRPYMPETYEVMHFIRNNILAKLLRLVAMILEVPEEAVLSTHAPGGSKTEYIRYVRSKARHARKSTS